MPIGLNKAYLRKYSPLPSPPYPPLRVPMTYPETWGPKVQFFLEESSPGSSSRSNGVPPSRPRRVGGSFFFGWVFRFGEFLVLMLVPGNINIGLCLLSAVPQH